MKIVSFKKRYIIALLLTALYGIFSYSTTIYLIHEHDHYAEDINILGKERMLLGQILFYAHEIFHHDKRVKIEDLKEVIKKFNDIEKTLQSKGYIFEEEAKKDFLKTVELFIAFGNNENNDNEKYLELDNSLGAQYEILVGCIDKFVLRTQTEAQEATEDVLVAKVILLLFLILLLAAEAIFIFLPADDEINKKTRELEDINRNLKERVRAEVTKNEEQTLQIIHQSRLATMGEMISMIAHQWRQPLASISAISGTLSLDIMMENYRADFFQKELESIDELAQHLSSTIDDFRDFFKTDKELCYEEIKSIVEKSFKIIAPTLEAKRITFDNNVEANIFVNSYVSEIKQVLLNIMKNAEDVLVERKIQNPTIWIRGTENNGFAELIIEDNAGGISDEVMKRIFEPYFTTKKSKDGTGLGLYMSKIIIEEHCKGKLSVENGEYGAKFTVKIPLSSEPNRKKAVEQSDF
ncbi:MAG: HAMP domain-containing sensor histidine kinase [Sulfurimonas sp.]|jgi:signal transduction histidine kinase